MSISSSLGTTLTGSNTGNQSGITFGGLSSGIDTSSIIDKLIQVEAIPLQTIQKSQQTIATKQAVYAQLSSQMSSLAQAAGTLNTSTAFNVVAASSSDSSVATVASTAGAIAGNYSLVVNSLAQAQKVATSPQTNTTDAMGLTGTAVINGKALQINASDSITNIASKINSLQSGVIASLIDGGAGKAYLTLTSTTSGASNKIQMADVSGGALGSLGLVTGADAIAKPITNGATSFAFSSTSTSIQSMLSGTGMSSGTFTINGTSVTVDPTTDTLQNVADKINSAGITGVTATVRSTVSSSGTTSYNLDITGASTPTLVDGGGILSSLGVVQKAAGNQLIAGQDASYSLDNVALTSSSNTVTTAIPGITLNLLKVSTTSPAVVPTTLSVTTDTSTVAKNINAFATAYNNIIGYISQNSTLDTKTYSSGPLLGDNIANQVQSSLSHMLFNNVPGATKYNNLAAIGFSLGTDGKITVDNTVLNAAISASPTDVAALFKSTGSSTSNNLSYVSSTSATKSSGTGSYAVVINQAATTQSFVAGTAQTGPSTTSEKLTFTGGLFASSSYSLNLDVGSTPTSIVNKINSDAKLKDVMFASLSGGKLRIDSKRYGSSGNFTVVSNQMSSSTNSGIGVGGEGTSVAGLDVSGTIGGEPATGQGRFLTGNDNNANTAGLQIQVSATSAGSVGSLQFSVGMGAQVNNMLSGFTDKINGLMTTVNKSLQTQLDDLQKQSDTLNAKLVTRRQELKTTFANMESAMATYQQQGQRLTAMLSSSNNG